MKGVGGHRGPPRLDHRRRHLLDHRQVQIGRGQAQRARCLGLELDIGQDRYGVAALDDALHVSERTEQGGAFDGKLHVRSR